MKSFFRFFTILVLVGTLGYCSSRKDDSLDRAVFNLIAFCPGGTVEACKGRCSSQFGENVTTDNFTEINNCFSSCQSSCDIRNILLLIEASK